MATEIVDVAETSGSTASYTYNTKAYGVIVGLAIAAFWGEGSLAITNSAGAVIHQILFSDINNGVTTKTYDEIIKTQGGIFQPILLQSGDVVSVGGAVEWNGGMRIVAADTLWEASLFL
jgi:hypothetical protein